MDTTVTLTPAQVEALQSLIGWALDEDHDSMYDDWLDQHTGYDGIVPVLRSLPTPLA